MIILKLSTMLNKYKCCVKKAQYLHCTGDDAIPKDKVSHHYIHSFQTFCRKSTSSRRTKKYIPQQKIEAHELETAMEVIGSDGGMPTEL